MPWFRICQPPSPTKKLIGRSVLPYNAENPDPEVPVQCCGSEIIFPDQDPALTLISDPK
jgi:hypothetical protein